MEEKIDQTFMNLALEEAEKAYSMGEVPVGAVAVLDGEMITGAHNLVESLQDPTAHAELLLLRKSTDLLGSRRLTGVTVYSTLEPCPMCSGALVLARIDRLVFGSFDPKAGACGTLLNIVQDKRFNHVVEITAPVLGERCSELLSSFFRDLRRGGYKIK